MASDVIRAPPIIIESFISTCILSAVRISSGESQARTISPNVSPPIPKIPWINETSASMITPWFSMTSMTLPGIKARTLTGCGSPRRIIWPVTWEIVSTIPLYGDRYMVLNIPKIPFVSARISPTLMISPTCTITHSGTSPGGMDNWLARLIGKISPGINVSATICCGSTFSPSFTRTLPDMGKTLLRLSVAR